jgi:transposase
MGAPYSLDLRERVVAAVAGGMSRAEAARRFDVSHSSAIRWAKRATETGTPAALPMGGKKPFALADEEAWIRTRVAEKPDITGRELLAELSERGVEVSYYGVWHFLDHIGLRFKKTISGARPACGGRNGLRYRSEGSGRWLFGGMTPQKNVAHGLLRTCMW